MFVVVYFSKPKFVVYIVRLKGIKLYEWSGELEWIHGIIK